MFPVLGSPMFRFGALGVMLGVWIAFVIWLSLTKRSQLQRVSGLAGMGAFTLCATYVLLILPIGGSSQEGGSSLGGVWQDYRLVVDAAGEQTFDFDLDKPCSLQVDALEVRGKNIEIRVLQNGHTVYQSGGQPGKVRGTVPVQEGVATVSVLNDDAHESKTVNLTVAGLPH
jgi:hypothetical protein